jgi:hypothetical protein
MSTTKQRPSDRRKEIIENMPASLQRAVLRIIDFHSGKANFIPKPDFANQIKELGFCTDKRYTTIERQIRDTSTDINLDETKEVLIIGSTGEGGYFAAETWEEFLEYYNVERHRADEITNKLEIMKRKAIRMFEPVGMSTDERAFQDQLL